MKRLIVQDLRGGISGMGGRVRCGVNYRGILYKEDIMSEIVRYEISSDEKGLLGYLTTGDFYHIHSDEMSELETWIYGILKEK